MIPSIALPYKQMNTHQQINFAKNLVSKMTADSQFKSLESYVKELETKLNEWQIAINNAQNGGKIKTIKKIEKGLTVRDKVFYLANQIEIMAEENETIIIAAGYQNQRKIAFSKKAFSTQQIEDFLITVA